MMYHAKIIKHKQVKGKSNNKKVGSKEKLKINFIGALQNLCLFC